MSFLDAIAVAGGFGEFAKVTNISIVRRNPNRAFVRIPFNYKTAIQSDQRNIDRKLVPGDTIVMP